MERRGLVFSIKQSAVPLGGLVAGALLPPVAERFGWGGGDRALEPHGPVGGTGSSSRYARGSTTTATPRIGAGSVRPASPSASFSRRRGSARW